MIQEQYKRFACKIMYLGIVFTILGLTACSKIEETAVFPSTTCSNHTIEDTAEDLANCLPRNPSVAQVKGQLRQWQRIADIHWGTDFWGSVTSIDLLPDHGVELVITYHKNLSEVTWSPQGMMAVLQKQNNQWKVIFESPAPSDALLYEAHTLEGNWGFHGLIHGDVTGDGLDDLIFDQSHYNGGHSSLGHTKILTFDGSTEAKIIYLEDNKGFASKEHYAIDEGMILFNSRGIKQWYDYDANTEAFILDHEEVNIESARLSAQTADDSQWAIFHKSTDLYRIQNDNITRFSLPNYSSYLAVLDDGYLYSGGSGRLMRMENGYLVDVLAMYAPMGEDVFGGPVDLAFAEDGSLWVATTYKLWYLNKEQSHIYDIYAEKVIIASDGSVWAVAWDGKAENRGTCCFMNIDGKVIKRYWFDTELPVTTDIEKQIRAMRSDG